MSALLQPGQTLICKASRAFTLVADPHHSLSSNVVGICAAETCGLSDYRLGCYGAERSGSAPSIAASAPNLRLAFQPKQYLRTYQDANDYQTPRLRSASLQRIPSARTGTQR